MLRLKALAAVVMCARLAISAMWGIFTILTSCSSPRLLHQPAAGPLVVDGHSLTFSTDIDPQLMRCLTAELRRVLDEILHRGVRALPAPVVTPQRSTDGADALLSWQYNLSGDYNQDGLVTINDLTPIGVHFGAQSGDPDWLSARVADGNTDGVVTINDITAIGQDWQAGLAEYIVEAADVADGPWVEVGRVARMDGVAPPSGGFLQFSYRVVGGSGRGFYRARGFAGSAASRLDRLRTATCFMYQIQELDAPGAVSALAATHYDLLVVEPTATVQGSESFDMMGMVAQLKNSSDSRGGKKLVIAYVDIGEAEDYRTYWKADWVAPTMNTPGTPDFLLTIDPDGWSGNYPVAYWDVRWQALMVDEASSVLRQVLAAGFDGIYLDWVEAYSEDQAVAAAAAAGINPAEAMVGFISHIRTIARQIDPEFLVIQQNAPYLIDDAAGLAPAIDALALEDIWFLGQADIPWGNPLGGDIPQQTSGPYSTAAISIQAAKYLATGLPVLTIDYCLDTANAAQVYTDSHALGFTPLVTQVSLSRITETPPPWY